MRLIARFAQSWALEKVAAGRGAKSCRCHPMASVAAVCSPQLRGGCECGQNSGCRERPRSRVSCALSLPLPFFFLLAHEHQLARACNESRSRINVALLHIGGGVHQMTHQFSLLPGLMLAGLLSQAMARSILHANFYEVALLQDSHRMEHIVPPRDLQGWQNLRVSAIAHFDPVVAEGLEPPALHEIIKHSYSRFPVVERGCLVGMLSRAKIQIAFGSGERATARIHRASGASDSRSPAPADRVGGWYRRCHRSRRWQTAGGCDASRSPASPAGGSRTRRNVTHEGCPKCRATRGTQFHRRMWLPQMTRSNMHCMKLWIE